MIVIKNNLLKAKGFTLVELLVVISIIAMLLAVMMPALGKAREQGKRIYCLNNLKQMSVASASYNYANDDYYPIAFWSNLGKKYCWDFTTYQKNGKTVYESGLLWQGEGIDEVQQCQSYKGKDNWAGGKFTGYNYNTSYIGHGQNESVSKGYGGLVINHPDPVWAGYKIVMPAKVTHVKRPVGTVLFGDGEYAGGANKCMRSPDSWAGDRDMSIKAGGTQGFRHGGKTNIAWADGHANSQDEVFTDSYDELYGRDYSANKIELDRHNENAKIKIGFLSKDNSLYDLE